MSRLKITAAGGLTAALLLPLGVFAGAGFAHGSASASEYQYGTTTTAKVLICHKAGNSGKYVTISVAKSAEKSFLRRGDTAGACTGGSKAHGASKPATTTTSSTTTAAAAQTQGASTGPGNSGSHSNAGGNGNGKGNGKNK